MKVIDFSDVYILCYVSMFGAKNSFSEYLCISIWALCNWGYIQSIRTEFLWVV